MKRVGLLWLVASGTAVLSITVDPLLGLGVLGWMAGCAWLARKL